MMYSEDDNGMATRKARLASPPARSRMPSNAELLRKDLARQLEREPHTIGTADPDRRIELGEVETELGRIRIAHDGDTIHIHGTAMLMSEIEDGLRQAIFATSAAFSGAQTAEEQRAQVAILGALMDRVLQRDQFLAAKVKERLHHERGGV
jgi:hypothetical protein